MFYFFVHNSSIIHEFNCLRCWVTPLKLSAATRSLKWYFPAIYLLIAPKDIVGMVQCGVMPFCCLNGCSIYIPTVNIPQITKLIENNKRHKCAKFQLSTTNSKDLAMQGVKKKLLIPHLRYLLTWEPKFRMLSY